MNIRSLAIALLLFLLHGAAYAADTPPNATIPEGVIYTIACSTTINGISMDNSNSACMTLVKSGSYHYNVFLPRGYHANAQRRFPAIFIASPAGNAGMENLADAVKERRWIVVMLAESKNNCDPGVDIGNFLAAHDDAKGRFRIQEGMKFVTGFSGGARIQSLNVGFRSGFAGLILQGAGFIMNPPCNYGMVSLEQSKDICVYGIFGANDPNRIEIGMMERMLPRHTIHRFTCFNGGHEWAPPDRMEDALDFCELNALKQLDISGDGAGFLNARVDNALNVYDVKSDDKFERYIELTRLSVALEAHSGGTNVVFKDRTAKIEVARKKLSESKKLSREIAAKNAYESIEKDETAILAQSMLSGNSSGLNELAQRYNACAKEHPGTVYGQKAAAKSKVKPKIRGQT